MNLPSIYPCVFIHVFTSIRQDPSCKTDSRSPIHEISSLLWNHVRLLYPPIWIHPSRIREAFITWLPRNAPGTWLWSMNHKFSGLNNETAVRINTAAYCVLVPRTERLVHGAWYEEHVMQHAKRYGSVRLSISMWLPLYTHTMTVQLKYFN
jgi:hypothetical protein